MFDQFYAHFRDFTNAFSILGENIPQPIIVCKLLNSLKGDYNMKFTTIEESKNVETLNINELVESIQTYEITFKPSKKNKDVEFKNSKNITFDSDNDSDDKNIVSFTRRFKN